MLFVVFLIVLLHSYYENGLGQLVLQLQPSLHNDGEKYVRVSLRLLAPTDEECLKLFSKIRRLERIGLYDYPAIRILGHDCYGHVNTCLGPLPLGHIRLQAEHEHHLRDDLLSVLVAETELIGAQPFLAALIE